ncbi:two-component system response regulator [Kiloniella laminariae]|uniref:two-component system response regulator n=1 Tax=Kiloniella laminariae TaxID=454162 RepID=UPI00036524D9|nr:GGDEF domain-containing response regulator [Kiloniella laminariae]
MTKVLILEDNEGDKILIEELLKKVPDFKYEFLWVATLELAIEKINSPDIGVALVDYNLGDGNGLDFVSAGQNVASFPMIIMTENKEDALDTMSLRAGAIDFLSKGEMTTSLLERTIRYAIERDKARQQLKEHQSLLEQQNIRLTAARQHLEAQNASISMLTNYLLTTVHSRTGQEGHFFEAHTQSHNLDRGVGIWHVDTTGEAIYTNRVVQNLFGFELNTIPHLNDLPLYFSLNDRPKIKRALSLWASGKSHTVEAEMLSLDNMEGERHIVLSAAPISSSDSYSGSLLLTVLDVTEKRIYEANLQDLVLRDPLTGIYNRLAFCELLPQALENAKRNNKIVAVLYLDVDNFKFINDTMGHHAGDTVLQNIAQKLREYTRASDVVARLSGDEFVVVLGNLGHREDVVSVIEKLCTCFEDLSITDAHTVALRLSIGVALFPQDHSDPEKLLSYADLALYQAKQRSGFTYEFFQSSMQESLSSRKRDEAELREAVTTMRDFAMCYQPLIDIEKNKLIGIEGLLRWQHPAEGYIFPDNFLSIAEQAGLILPIGDWVLEEACQHYKYWQEAGLKSGMVSLNLSAAQLYQRGFVEKIACVFQKNNVPPKGVMFEITERMVIEDMDTTLNGICELRDMGAQIALDNFGTGHSSLSLLKTVPVDFLKIDKSFVSELDHHPRNRIIVEHVIRMAKQLGVSVIAEGVEREEELLCLKKFGCRYMQGSLYSSALSADEIVPWFTESLRYTPSGPQ